MNYGLDISNFSDIEESRQNELIRVVKRYHELLKLDFTKGLVDSFSLGKTRPLWLECQNIKEEAFVSNVRLLEFDKMSLFEKALIRGHWVAANDLLEHHFYIQSFNPTHQSVWADVKGGIEKRYTQSPKQLSVKKGAKLEKLAFSPTEKKAFLNFIRVLVKNLSPSLKAGFNKSNSLKQSNHWIYSHHTFKQPLNTYSFFLKRDMPFSWTQPLFNIFLKAEFDVNEGATSKKSILLSAIASYNTPVCQWLIKHGAWKDLIPPLTFWSSTLKNLPYHFLIPKESDLFTHWDFLKSVFPLKESQLFTLLSIQPNSEDQEKVLEAFRRWVVFDSKKALQEAIPERPNQGRAFSKRFL